MNKYIFYGLIGLCYCIVGILAYIKKEFIIKLDNIQATSLGILFVIYGLFRFYRAVKGYRNEN